MTTMDEGGEGGDTMPPSTTFSRDTRHSCLRILPENGHRCLMDDASSSSSSYGFQAWFSVSVNYSSAPSLIVVYAEPTMYLSSKGGVTSLVERQRSRRCRHRANVIAVVRRWCHIPLRAIGDSL